MARIAIPYTTEPKTHSPSGGLDYLKPANVDYDGITRGLSTLSAGVGRLQAGLEQEAAKKKIEEEQIKRMKFKVDIDNWQQSMDDLYGQYKTEQDPTDATSEERWDTTYDNHRKEFRSKLTDPLQQAEFDQYASGRSFYYRDDLRSFQGLQRSKYGEQVVDDRLNSAKLRLHNNTNFDLYMSEKKEVDNIIELQTHLSPAQKDAEKRQAERELLGIMFGKEYHDTRGIRPRDPDAPPTAEGLITSGNIDLTKRKFVPVPGSREDRPPTDVESLRSMTFEENGQFVVVPTLDHDGKRMSRDDAIKFYEKTGEHLGKFHTEEQANAYAEKLSAYMGKRYKGEKYYEPGSPQQAIVDAAKEFDIDPFYLALVLAKETDLTFSTSKWGGNNNSFLGLIQADEDTRKRYNIYPGQPFAEQMKGAVQYLKDRGFKKGMNFHQLYATILAGRPDLVNARDKNGSIDFHVAQMIDPNGRFFKAAQALMGNEIDLNGIDTDPRYSALPFEDREAIKTKVDADVKAEEAEAQKERDNLAAQMRDNLYKRLSSGLADDRDIKALDDAGVMDYDQLAKAREIYAKYHKDADRAQVAARRIARGEVFDRTNETDKDDFNAYFGPVGKAEVEAMNDDYVDNYILPKIDQVGMIPGEIGGVLKTMARSNNPQQATWALQQLAKFEEANQGAYDTFFDQQLRSDVDYYAMMKGQAKDADLLADINGTGKTSEQMRLENTLKEEAKAILKDDPTMSDNLITNWNPYVTILGYGFSGKKPTVPGLAWAHQMMTSDFNAVFVQMYARYKNKETAGAETMKVLDKIWGVSNVGGGKYLMKYPVEKFYPPGADGHAAYERQLRRDEMIPEGWQFQLIGTEQTQEDIANGRPPGYFVALYNPNTGQYKALQSGDQRKMDFDPVRGYEGGPYSGLIFPTPGAIAQNKPIYFTLEEQEKNYISTSNALKNAQSNRDEYFIKTYQPMLSKMEAMHPNEEAFKYMPPDMKAELLRLTDELDDAKLMNTAAEAAVKHANVGFGALHPERTSEIEKQMLERRFKERKLMLDPSARPDWTPGIDRGPRRKEGAAKEAETKAWEDFLLKGQERRARQRQRRAREEGKM